MDLTETFKHSFKLETDVTNIEIVSCVPLIVVCPVMVFLSLLVTSVKGIIITFCEPNKPGYLLGENSDHFHCLRRPLLFNFVIF